MHPSFSRKNSLAATVASTLDKYNSMSLKDYLNETRANPQVQHGGLFYLEQPENVEKINAFIKRFLDGTHIDADQQIRHLFMHLQSVGLTVPEYDGGSGTYEVNQYGKEIRNPEEDDAVTNNLMFPRRRMKGNLKIKKTMVPGGRYMVDAELYMSKA